MDTAPRLRKAKRAHRCTERNYHDIKPGDLYLHAVAAPWSDVNSGKKWWVIKACLRCANEFGLHTAGTRAKADTAQASGKLPTPYAQPDT